MALRRSSVSLGAAGPKGVQFTYGVGKNRPKPGEYKRHSAFQKYWSTWIGGPFFASTEVNKINDFGEGMLEPHVQGMGPGSIPKQIVDEYYVRPVPKIGPGEALVDAQTVGPQFERSKWKFNQFQAITVDYKKKVKLEDSPAFQRHGAAAKATMAKPTRRDGQNLIAQANLAEFQRHIDYAKNRTFGELKREYAPKLAMHSDPIDVHEGSQYLQKYRTEHLPGVNNTNPLGPKPHRVFLAKVEGETPEDVAKRALPAW